MTTDPRLIVHVLGASRGESIILEIPGDRWGVVDCCAGSAWDRDENATLRFLRERGVRGLEFLCLTHPHDDHFRGMSHLLEEFPVRYFWRFEGLSGPKFYQLVEYLIADAEGDGRASVIADSNEFLKIHELINKRRAAQEPAPLKVRRASVSKRLYPVPPDDSAEFRIEGLAPTGDLVDRYERGLLMHLEGDGAGLPTAHHNLVSAALLVVFGRTRIILGGDVEKEGWRDVIAEYGAENLAADMVKVSHHGSDNGYCKGLWALFAAKRKPVAVVTAYASKNLPRKDALAHIGGHAEILTTCLTALKDSQVPEDLRHGELKARIALMAKMMGRIVYESRHECGRCTLVFDAEGQCVERDLVPPAGSISTVA